jgi:hypothetical protein
MPRADMFRLFGAILLCRNAEKQESPGQRPGFWLQFKETL